MKQLDEQIAYKKYKNKLKRLQTGGEDRTVQVNLALPRLDFNIVQNVNVIKEHGIPTIHDLIKHLADNVLPAVPAEQRARGEEFRVSSCRLSRPNNQPIDPIYYINTNLENGQNYYLDYYFARRIRPLPKRVALLRQDANEGFEMPPEPNGNNDPMEIG